MALKITTEGYLKIERPIGEIFTVNEMSDLLRTDVDYVKFVDMGTFILVVDGAPERTMNFVGSLYFRFGIFGNLLVISGNEIDKKSPIVSTENTKWAVDELEAGMIKNIKDVLNIYKMVMTNEEQSQSSVPPNAVPAKQTEKKTKGKTVYHFDPEKEGEMSEDELQFTEQFYQNAYKALKHVKNIDVSNIVLYEDYEVIIKFIPGKVKKTINDMINYFSSIEEYEKCAVLRDIVENVKDVSQQDSNNAVQE